MASGWPESRRRRAPRRRVRVSYVCSWWCTRARKRRGGGSQAHGDLKGADDVVGDELVRRRRRRGSPAMAVRARLVRRLRGTRALGARLARRSRGRRSFWTGWRGVETTGSTATAVVRRRWRRPWRGSARERNWGRMEVSRGSGQRRGACPGQQDGEGRRQGGDQLRGTR